MRVASVAVCTLLFLALTVPTSYVEIKVCLMLIASIALMMAYLTQTTHISSSLFHAVLFIASLGSLFSLYGYINGNPGATRVLTLWVIWPFFYLFASSLLIQARSFFWVKRIFDAAFLSVLFYSFYYLAYSTGMVPEYLYMELDLGQGIGIHDGYTEFSLHSIASLIFLLPFYVHYKFELYKRNGKLQLLSIVTIIAAAALSILTGRKIIILLLGLLPLFIFLSNKFLDNKFFFRPGLGFVFLFGISAAGIGIFLSRSGFVFDSFINMFVAGFDFVNGDAGAIDRHLMFNALVQGWTESSLLFGAGNGAVADFVSSPDMPWAYELTYGYLLFTTGAVGLCFLFGWYGYSLLKLRMAILNRPDLVVYAAPMLTGSVMFCIAAATNPYFSKFDYLWIVHLPFIISAWSRFQVKIPNS